MKVNKNMLLHKLKEFVKANNKHYNFPDNTTMELDYYDDYLYTKLISLSIKNDVLKITTETTEHGVETENLNDFHQDIVEDVYKLVIE